MTRDEIETRVVGVVAEALDHPREKVSLDASLVDDLGAESIDFLDIVFRLESEFDVKIPESEIWMGAMEGAESPLEIASRVEGLRAARPEFRWDRLPKTITQKDLPRLLTPRTIVDYLDRRLAAEREP
ncbi:MAG TPA: acyl carrier protein [Thermoanaerobaculia bacterium]|nr:acyl carrier protein [Thermoanaerobaculia bacterium]